MKMPIVTGISLLVDQIVEDDRRAELALLVDVGVAVLKHHHAGRRLSAVLRRHIDPIIAVRAGEDFAVPGVLGDFALRHVGLPG